MRKGFIIFMVLLSVFLAIGCTGSNKEQPANKTETPASTPVREVTPATETARTITIGGNNTSASRTTIVGNNTTATSTTIAGKRDTITIVNTTGSGGVIK